MVKISRAWKISQPENVNIAIMLSYPPSYYRRRLQKLGFAGKDKILLDAGCGGGHWSVVASYLNNKVYGIDLTEKYLSYAKDLKKRFRRENIDLRQGKVEKLPYKNNSFDYIICYSVWMFTDKEKALKEFYRVLKPGGLLYLGSIIGHAWYPQLISKGLKEKKFGLIPGAVKSILNGVPLSEEKTKELIEENGFQLLELSSDGKVGNKKIKVQPIYQGKILGVWAVFEVLAKKKG